MYFRLALTICAVLIMIGCDEVTKIDATKEQAAASGSIARGWLPNILPRSSTSIKTTNDLDLNTSRASFAFDPEEWDSFAAHLVPLGQTRPPFKDWNRTVENYQSRGYEAKAFEGDRSWWVFFCKPTEGRCEGFMWPRRDRAAADK